MDKRKHSQRKEHLAHEAAEWIERLQRHGDREDPTFIEYLRESPLHVEEILIAETLDRELERLVDPEHEIDVEDLIARAGNVVPLDARPLSREGSIADGQTDRTNESRDRGWPPTERADHKWAKRTPWLVAATVGAAAAIVMAVVNAPFLNDWLHPGVYATSVGEQRAVELSDGSAISINAKSSLRVAYSETARDVYLERGQAMFSVAKDATRPFRVHVGMNLVQAVGTKFDVSLRPDRFNVAVIEGTVKIAAARASTPADAALATLAHAARVTAGEAVTVFDAGEVSAPRPINIPDISAWQQRRLVFSDNTLVEIADEFARFNRTPHLRIEGDALRARRFSGVFDADAPEALLVYLATDETIAFDRRGDEIVIMPRPLIVQSPR